MTSSTKPPGLKTGIANPRCYAAALLDCTRETDQEHYISKSLLGRLGKNFMADGFPWIPRGTAKKLTNATMTAGVLCKRHNNALSPLDATICKLYDALMSYHRGEKLHIELDGEELERWAIKTLLGMLVSKNVRAFDGTKGILDAVPDPYVKILFGIDEMPLNCGFYFTGIAPPGSKPTGLSIAPRARGNDDGTPGSIYAVDINRTATRWRCSSRFSRNGTSGAR